MAASNMARLYCAVKDEKYRKRLLDLFSSAHDHLLDSPRLLSAFIFHSALPRQVSRTMPRGLAERVTGTSLLLTQDQ